MCNEELITPLNTDNIADETDTDGMFTVTSDECLVEGVTVKDGAIYFGTLNEKIEENNYYFVQYRLALSSKRRNNDER